jgi:hypothetical protein
MVIHILLGHYTYFLVQVLIVVHTHAFSTRAFWTLHLLLVQVLKVVRTHACCTYAYGHGHLFLVQVLKVVHGLYTCCLFKLRLSLDFTLVVC